MSITTRLAAAAAARAPQGEDRPDAPRQTPDRTTRQDGYRDDSPVFAWQAECERQPGCDYSRMRATLLWARSHSAATTSDLWQHYHSQAQ